jgi:hypothetical protein
VRVRCRLGFVVSRVVAYASRPRKCYGSASGVRSPYRSAEQVWSYLIEYSHEVDWQQGVLSSRPEPPGPATVGTVKTKVRKTPFGKQRFTVKVTRFDDAAREWEDVVLDGIWWPARRVKYRVEPVGGGPGYALTL